MTPGPGGGVPAAPNLARITATYLQVARSTDSPRKWLLRLLVDSVNVVHGGEFVRPGDEVDAFTFDPVEEPTAGASLRAEAEFVGGPRGGTFHLHRVEQTEP